MQLAFYFDQTRCTGCYACAVACKDWHDVPAGPAKWINVVAIERGKYPEPFLAYLPSHCYHCIKPACVSACPVDGVLQVSEHLMGAGLVYDKNEVVVGTVDAGNGVAELRFDLVFQCVVFCFFRIRHSKGTPRARLLRAGPGRRYRPTVRCRTRGDSA